MELEYEYSGDEDWLHFLELHQREPLSGDFFDPKNDTCYGVHSHEGLDLMVVAFSYFGRENIAAWIDAPLEILGGRSPLECMKTCSLHRRLRVYLTQLP
ncbi:MAG: hypothetical protein AAF394_03130 [Planctomycetota bacterium]